MRYFSDVSAKGSRPTYASQLIGRRFDAVQHRGHTLVSDLGTNLAYNATLFSQGSLIITIDGSYSAGVVMMATMAFRIKDDARKMQLLH